MNIRGIIWLNNIVDKLAINIRLKLTKSKNY